MRKSISCNAESGANHITATNHLSKPLLLQYSALALPLAFVGLPIYVYIPEYYATQFGAPLATIGLILMLVRLFDAVQDPLIGLFSDRYPTFRLSIMVVGIVMLLIGFVALFRPNENHLLTWFTVTLMLATTGFSIVTINLNTVGALWGRGPSAKTEIVSYREVWGLIGLLLATLLPSILMLNLSASMTYDLISIIVTVLIVIALPLFIRFYRQADLGEAGVEVCGKAGGEAGGEAGGTVRGTVGGQVRGTVARFRAIPKATRSLYWIYAISMTASSIPSVLVIFYVRDLLGSFNYLGLFLGLYFISAMVGIGVWYRLSAAFENKVGVWGAGMLIGIIGFIWAATLGKGDVLPFAVICILTGVALGAELIFPVSILADQIDQSRLREGANSINQASSTAQSNRTIQTDTGIQADSTLWIGIMTLISKLALALSAGMVLPLLEWMGFLPDRQNSVSALMGLALLYAALPCLLKSIAVIQLYVKRDALTLNL